MNTKEKFTHNNKVLRKPYHLAEDFVVYRCCCDLFTTNANQFTKKMKFG
ncbi:protein of unknown function [Ruminococcaceae bacterium BL-4]|nr:protein of unknown function [Ruminococcaceae bacterium BL-4]